MSQANGTYHPALASVLRMSRYDIDLDRQIDAALERHRQGDFWTAEKEYRRILRKHPRHARVSGLLAALEQQRGRGQLALQLVNRAVEGDVHDAMHAYNRGTVLFALGRYTDAVAAYQEAIDKHEGYALAYHDLGVTLLELCQPEPAVYAMRQAV